MTVRVRDCIDCGARVLGGPTRCEHCAAEYCNAGPSPVAKETNPKDALATAEGRLDMSCVPWRVMPQVPATYAGSVVLVEVSIAMLEGAWKYGAFNYRKDGVRASVYMSAFGRHIMPTVCGEDADPDSGLPHLIKALTCMLVVADAQCSGGDLFVDDRPPFQGKPRVETGPTAFGQMAKWFNERDDQALFNAGAILVEQRVAQVEAEFRPAHVSAAADLRAYSRQAMADLAARMKAAGFPEPKARVVG